jgi:hypothetical protein
VRLAPVGAGRGAKISAVLSVVDRALAHAIQGETHVIETSGITSPFVASEQKFVNVSIDKFLAAAVTSVGSVRESHDRIRDLGQSGLQ